MSLVDGSMPTLAETVTKKLTPRDMFLSQKAAMTDGYWILRNIKDTKTYPHDFVTAFAPYPSMDSQHEYLSPGGIGDYIGISSKSQYKDEAFKFIKWYQTEGALYLANAGRVASSKAINGEDVAARMLEGAEALFDKQSFIDVYLGGKINKVAMQTETKAAPEIAKIVQEEGENVLTKGISVDDGIKNMKRRADEELKKAK